MITDEEPLCLRCYGARADCVLDDCAYLICLEHFRFQIVSFDRHLSTVQGGIPCMMPSSQMNHIPAPVSPLKRRAASRETARQHT